MGRGDPERCHGGAGMAVEFPGRVVDAGRICTVRMAGNGDAARP